MSKKPNPFAKAADTAMKAPVKKGKGKGKGGKKVDPYEKGS